MNVAFWILIIAILVAVIYCLQTSSSRDGYGQDASIRASAGWISGPSYGFDPVAEYAEQIEEDRLRRRHLAQKLGCKVICEHGSAGDCDQCIGGRIHLLTNNKSDANYKYKSMVGTPDANIGPSYEGFCKECAGTEEIEAFERMNKN